MWRKPLESNDHTLMNVSECDIHGRPGLRARCIREGGDRKQFVSAGADDALLFHRTFLLELLSSETKNGKRDRARALCAQVYLISFGLSASATLGDIHGAQ